MMRLGALTVCAVFCAGAASAQPSAEDRATATTLFKEGRSLMAQSRFGEACKKFADSQRLDPGGGTLLNLAICHEKEGKTASAWAELEEALALAIRERNAAREKLARERLAAVEPLLSKLTISVAPAADGPELEVRRNGSVVPRSAWGLPVAVDPGEQRIEVTAPGKRPWTRALTVPSGPHSGSMTVEALEDEVAEPVTAPPPVPVSPPPAVAARPAPVAPTPRPAEREAPDGTGEVAGWITLGVGVAGLGAGTYFGLHAKSLLTDADAECPEDRCSSRGLDLNDRAAKSADLATASFAVGLVALGVGTYLLLTSAPRSASSVAAVGSRRRPVALGW